MEPSPLWNFNIVVYHISIPVLYSCALYIKIVHFPHPSSQWQEPLLTSFEAMWSDLTLSRSEKLSDMLKFTQNSQNDIFLNWKVIIHSVLGSEALVVNLFRLLCFVWLCGLFLVYEFYCACSHYEALRSALHLFPLILMITVVGRQCFHRLFADELTEAQRR